MAFSKSCRDLVVAQSVANLPAGSHTYTTAFVKGKTKVRYGYFEICARAMDSQASSAFWFYDITPEVQKKLAVRNGEGNGLSFLTTWSRTEPWKREGRERAGEAPGAPNPPINGYHAVGVDVRPLAAKPQGTVEVWELPSEGGSPVRVTVRH